MLDIEPPVVICDKEEMIKASIKNEIIIKASSLFKIGAMVANCSELENGSKK